MPENPRLLRADAARNRARVLTVAYESFAEGSLAVPIDEIARRAGVGAGTVYRHFPTKEALVAAIAANRLEHLVDRAESFTVPRRLARPSSPISTCSSRRAASTGAWSRRSPVPVPAPLPRSPTPSSASPRCSALLTRAQQAGAVRSDIGVKDVRTLLVGCQAMQRSSEEPATVQRTIAVIRDGLTPRSTEGQVAG